MVVGIEAPSLKWAPTRFFIEFKRSRNLYKEQIAKRNKALRVKTTPASYKTSIDDYDLRQFVAGKLVQENSK